MEIFKWIAVIVFLVMGAELLKYQIRMKHNRSIDEDELKDIKDQLKQMQELEKRIQTLEKIVTDPGENLKRKIDGL